VRRREFITLVGDVAAIVGCNEVFAQDAQDRGDRN
jgi:hypothetical protein